MIHRFFLIIKYLIWPLPNDPTKLKKLAMDLQVSRAYMPRSDVVNTALLQRGIHRRLMAFSKGTTYLIFLAVIFFSAIGLFLTLLFETTSQLFETISKLFETTSKARR